MGNWSIKAAGPIKVKKDDGQELHQLDIDGMNNIINDHENQGYELVNIVNYPIQGWGMNHLLLFFWRKEAGPCPLKMPLGPARDIQLDVE